MPNFLDRARLAIGAKIAGKAFLRPADTYWGQSSYAGSAGSSKKIGQSGSFAFPPLGGQSYGYSPWGGIFGVHLPATEFDFARLVGDPWRHAAVFACLRYIMTTIVEPRIMVVNQTGEQKGEEVENHPVTKLLRRPNGDYSGNTLLASMALSWNVNGNAYLWKQRSNDGKVVKLWWIPHYSIWPQYPADGSAWLTHYVYLPYGLGRYYRIPKEDILHFRNGQDPRQERLGLAPLAAVLRDIFGDSECETLTAAMVHNHNIPPVIVSPDYPGGKINEDGAKSLKRILGDDYAADQAGRMAVSPLPVKVQQISYSPEQMGMGRLRDVYQAMICSALGVHPAVAMMPIGLEKGQDRHNFTQAARITHNANILPTMSSWCEQLDDTLLVEFEKDVDRYDVQADYSLVRALSETEDEMADRVRKDYLSSGIDRAEFRAARGYQVNSEDKGHFIQDSRAAANRAWKPTDPGADGADVGDESGGSGSGGNGLGLIHWRENPGRSDWTYNEGGAPLPKEKRLGAFYRFLAEQRESAGDALALNGNGHRDKIGV